MEKHLLIPTNFSKHSWNSLIFAMNMYKKHACTFYLINAYDSQNFLSEAIALGKKDDEETEKHISEKGLDRIMKGLSFRKENPKHQFQTISHEGDLVEGVQDSVDKYGIDLIVLGSKGDSAGINSGHENSISRITEKVEQCPVLVIPEEYELKSDKKLEIVFPSNFRIPFKQKELLPLVELSESLDASVRVLYINSDLKPLTSEQEEIKAELAGHLSEIPFGFHTLTQTSPSTGVHLFIESRECDFLALYQRKQGFFSRLFQHSRTNELNFDPRLPVLILKELK
ncbi:universal stress protein [Christiangramia aestuarii]|uniref:Universal stress protein n=1 Tax=Christiangramia aestuarii TaxID=1028746 RepID=A0A7K1LS34_9FLAO|nr:universal stress protein [Christiangramia aestuarii]MUP43603.1 universal stress protein [Christiangramia aestuarii]